MVGTTPEFVVFDVPASLDMGIAREARGDVGELTTAVRSDVE
jgi:hypothetical protein